MSRDLKAQFVSVTLCNVKSYICFNKKCFWRKTGFIQKIVFDSIAKSLILSTGRKCCKRKPDLTGDVFRQVHQNSQVPTSHHLPGLPGALRQLQALAQSLSRAAIPLRAQCYKVRVGQNNREHRQVPGSCLLSY